MSIFICDSHAGMHKRAYIPVIIIPGGRVPVIVIILPTGRDIGNLWAARKFL